MKLSDIKPCDKCGGKITPMIHEVTVVRHWVKADAVNRTLGLNQVFGGNALGIAEVFSPDSSVTDELDTHTAMLCQGCALDTLALVMTEE